MKNRERSKNATFVDGIETFDEFSPEDKLGDVLKKKPLDRLEVVSLVVNLVKKEGEENEAKTQAAIHKIEQIANRFGLQVLDILVTEFLCDLLVQVNREMLREILEIDMVIEVDRPHGFEVEDILEKDLKDIQIGRTPTPDSHGILVMDSGIIRHPLMEQSLNEDGIVGLPDRREMDDRVHGTMVAGTALFGNIEKRLNQNKPLDQEVNIFSAKIFYQHGRQSLPDPNRLVSGLIKKSLEEIHSNFPRCKVINLSFGYDDNVMLPNKRQFNLAALIDELALRYKDVIFVISVGNLSEKFYQSHTFPDYLADGIEDIRIVDPSTSIHAISVGALQESNEGDIPSNITRIGPGLNSMIKPDLVEIGGGFHKPIVVLNSDFRTRPLTKSCGTSHSTPIIANYLAQLMNKFPEYSRNMIKALLISSARLPDYMPVQFPIWNSSINEQEILRILSVYGYGKPRFEDAVSSTDNMVALIYEGKIQINHVRYFMIDIPPEFARESGKRKISVTLVYDPPIRPQRAGYVGIDMESHLFRNRDVEDVQEKYSGIDLTKGEEESDADNEDDEEGSKTPKELLKDEIKLKPGVNLRKKSPHQMAFVKLTSRYKMDDSKPLVLAVICQKRWKMDEGTEQDFAVVVRLEHSENVDLYNKVRNLNQVQTQAKPRVRV